MSLLEYIMRQPLSQLILSKYYLWLYPFLLICYLSKTKKGQNKKRNERKVRCQNDSFRILSKRMDALKIKRVAMLKATAELAEFLMSSRNDLKNF